MKVKSYKTIFKDGSICLSECGYFIADGRKTYNNPALLANFFSDSIGIGSYADEYVFIACLNTKMKMIGCFQASHGSVDSSMFPVREILQKALLIGAVNIALSHNHPSGDCTPSDCDIAATGRLKKAADIIGLNLIDHVIVHEKNYFSFMENDLFSGVTK